MKKQIASIVTTLLLFCGAAHAASVAGSVGDFHSQKALKGVSIVVNVGGDRYTAKTSGDGNYYVDIPDSKLGQTAVIYVMGVKGKTFTVKSTYALNFRFR